MPNLIDFDDKSMKINIEFIEGEKLRDVFHQSPSVFSREIGNIVGLMHNLGLSLKG